MAHTSSVGSAIGMAGSWLFAGLCLAGSIIYFDEIGKAGRWALGSRTATSGAAQADIDAPVRDEVVSEVLPSGHVVLQADSRGHFITDAQVNGRSVEVMVDTGASSVALSWEDAQAAGIYVGPSDFTLYANTANGKARIAPVTIESISIGNITVRNVKGAVAEKGKLSGTLLGMTFLGRLSRAELSRGKMILEE